MKMHKNQTSTMQLEFLDTEAKPSAQSTVSRRSSRTMPMLTRTKSHSGDVEGEEKRGVLRKVKKGAAKTAAALGLIILVIL